MIFTDYYGEQSCTAGRSASSPGKGVFRTGLSKSASRAPQLASSKEDPTIAELLKPRAMPPASSARTISADKE